jgi:hypothetical protein
MFHVTKADSPERMWSQAIVYPLRSMRLNVCRGCVQRARARSSLKRSYPLVPRLPRSSAPPERAASVPISRAGGRTLRCSTKCFKKIRGRVNDLPLPSPEKSSSRILGMWPPGLAKQRRRGSNRAPRAERPSPWRPFVFVPGTTQRLTVRY